MIFRKFKNGEEVSFCSVDTPEEALELMIDPMWTNYDEIMAYMKETIYGFQAAMPRKPDGEPGDFWEIKGFASAEDKMPAEVRKVKLPLNQIGDKIWLGQSTIERFQNIFKCRVCDGKGVIDNPDFESCRNEQVRKHHGMKEGDCDHCDREVKSECNKGERISCTNDFCNNGMEMLTFKEFIDRYKEKET